MAQRDDDSAVNTTQADQQELNNRLGVGATALGVYVAAKEGNAVVTVNTPFDQDFNNEMQKINDMNEKFGQETIAQAPAAAERCKANAPEKCTNLLNAAGKKSERFMKLNLNAGAGGEYRKQYCATVVLQDAFNQCAPIYENNDMPECASLIRQQADELSGSAKQIKQNLGAVTGGQTVSFVNCDELQSK